MNRLPLIPTWLGVFITTTLVEWPGTVLAADKPFTHPGILHSRAELDFVKAKVATREEPWKSAWEELRSHGISKLDWQPRPAKDVVRGPYNNPDIGGTDLMRDAAAAYSHAIQWHITGERAHAGKAVGILNAYATTLKSVGGHDAKLLVGMVGISFANAAEIIRHTDAAWSDRDQRQFKHLLTDLFYPVIKDFYPTANGNWDAAMIQTMLAMGVFLDDREMFQRAVDYYLNGQVVKKIRPERWQSAHASWGTLMHAGQPVPQRDDTHRGPGTRRLPSP